MKIEASTEYGGGLHQRISAALTPERITEVLGVPEIAPCDAGKTDHEWAFTADGVPCGIWSYKGHRWSTSGPRAVFVELFGTQAVL